MSGIGIYYLKHGDKMYIGQTYAGFEKRFNQHRTTAYGVDTRQINKPLYRAIRLYGWDTFEKGILCECSIEELDDKETFYVDQYKTFHPDGYNLTKGGNSNAARSRLSKETMRKALIKRHQLKPTTTATKTKISTSLKKWYSTVGETIDTKNKKSNSHRVRGHGLPRYINVRIFPKKTVYAISKHPKMPYKQFSNLSDCLMFLYILDHGEELREQIKAILQKIEEFQSRQLKITNQIDAILQMIEGIKQQFCKV
jgi:group I intron endonuclease